MSNLVVRMREAIKDVNGNWPLTTGNIMDDFDFSDIKALLAVADAAQAHMNIDNPLECEHTYALRSALSALNGKEQG